MVETLLIVFFVGGGVVGAALMFAAVLLELGEYRTKFRRSVSGTSELILGRSNPEERSRRPQKAPEVERIARWCLLSAGAAASLGGLFLVSTLFAPPPTPWSFAVLILGFSFGALLIALPWYSFGTKLRRMMEHV